MRFLIAFLKYLPSFFLTQLPLFSFLFFFFFLVRTCFFLQSKQTLLLMALEISEGHDWKHFLCSKRNNHSGLFTKKEQPEIKWSGNLNGSCLLNTTCVLSLVRDQMQVKGSVLWRNIKTFESWELAYGNSTTLLIFSSSFHLCMKKMCPGLSEWKDCT